LAVNLQMQSHLDRAVTLLKVMSGGILCGISFGFVMSLVSNGFVIGVQWLTTFRESSLLQTFTIGGLPFSLGPLISLLLAAALLLVVRRVFQITRWHGPADSIYAAHRTDNELDVRAGFGSTLAAFISASGGASVGQYGPLVHFGATMGSFLRQMTGGVLTTDVFIGCGVAGAIAAGFNAPIAGLVFAHEAILRHFSMRAIAPIAIASISAVWFSDRLFDVAPLFTMDSSGFDMAQMLPSALVAGPVFGIVAVLFMLAIRYAARFAATSGWSPARLLVTAAIISGLVGTAVPEVLGLGTGPLAHMLEGGFEIEFLAVLLVLKLVATALCIGFGMFGGVFSPALFVGAAAGAICGRIVAALGIIGAVPTLAICGMAAVASAVIGAPVSGVVIILEMTMSYEFALAAMLSIVVAIMVSNLLFGHSFFDRQLRDRDIDISQGRGQLLLLETTVRELVSQNYVRLKPGIKSNTAMEELLKQSVTEGYIVSGDNRLVGKISMPMLMNIASDVIVDDIFEKQPIAIKHDASLLQAIEVASSFVGESIPVIELETRKMLGVVTEADLFQLYLSTQTKVVDLERA